QLPCTIRRAGPAMRAVVVVREARVEGEVIGRVALTRAASDDAEHGQEGQHPLSLLCLIDAPQGRRSEAGTIARVSAPEIEAMVVDALRALYPDDAASGSLLRPCSSEPPRTSSALCRLCDRSPGRRHRAHRAALDASDDGVARARDVLS